MTADAATRGIRMVDPRGSIAMFSRDVYPPYNRPPLTKALWKGKPIEQIFRRTHERDVNLYLGRTIQAIDRQSKVVVDDSGNPYRYQKLLLATGGVPRRFSFGDPGIIYYRTLADYERLRSMTTSPHRVAVIGGGFIGSELAAALKMNGQDVALIFPENGLGGRVYPPDLAQFLTGYFKEHGVDVFPNTRVSGIRKNGDRWVVRSDRGEFVTADILIAGIGIIPETQLAQAAGLSVGNGIVVNEYLQTDDPDIFSAGDVANFYNPALDAKIRVEHEDNANTMGMLAGRNMAGEHFHYDYLPYFYSDIFDHSYEALGELNPDLEIVSDWQDPYRKGVVYYLREGRIRGVLLWNILGRISNARELILEKTASNSEKVKGRISY